MSLLLRRHRAKDKPVHKEPVSFDFPKHIGGGWYELSTGEKVQGKDDAKDKQKEVGD